MKKERIKDKKLKLYYDFLRSSGYQEKDLSLEDYERIIKYDKKELTK